MRQRDCSCVPTDFVEPQTEWARKIADAQKQTENAKPDEKSIPTKIREHLAARITELYEEILPQDLEEGEETEAEEDGESEQDTEYKLSIEMVDASIFVPSIGYCNQTFNNFPIFGSDNLSTEGSSWNSPFSLQIFVF